MSEIAWARSRYEEMWKRWLEMLMKFIKFGRNKHPQEDILEFFTPQHDVNVVKTFEHFLTEHVSTLQCVYQRVSILCIWMVQIRPLALTSVMAQIS